MCIRDSRIFVTESSCTNNLWYCVSFSKTTPANGACTNTAEYNDIQIKIIAIVLVCFDSPTIADIIKIALIEYNIISTPIKGTRMNVVANVPKILPTVDNEYKFPAVCPIVWMDFALNFIAKGVTAPNKKAGANKNTILEINGPYISPILNNKIILKILLVKNVESNV